VELSPRFFLHMKVKSLASGAQRLSYFSAGLLANNHCKPIGDHASRG
jgi:hypothetical protein